MTIIECHAEIWHLKLIHSYKQCISGMPENFVGKYLINYGYKSPAFQIFHSFSILRHSYSYSIKKFDEHADLMYIIVG